MKVLFLIISIFFISSPTWSETVTIDDLKEKNGFYYKKFNIFSPLDFLYRFTGIVESFYENGNLRNKVNYKDAEPKGLIEWYYENGQLEKKGNYKEGLREDGLWEFYYKNGQLLEKGNFKDGRKDGTWEYFYKNGQLSSSGNWKDNNPDGLWEEYHLSLIHI